MDDYNAKFGKAFLKMTHRLNVSQLLLERLLFCRDLIRAMLV